MSNHIHVIWKIQYGYRPKEVQLSFMKFTAQMIIKDLRNNHKEVLEKFRVNASDRKYQIFERNALSISLWTQAVFKQKLEYIHANPVVQVYVNFLKSISTHLPHTIKKEGVNGTLLCITRHSSVCW